MKKIVVLSGAGISKESGIDTFRDSNGLWEKYEINEVATPSGWTKNPKLVLDFYNERRRQLKSVEPNSAHLGFAGLEKHFKVIIVTQNVDNLHERAGSSNIIHLHGELTKSRSSADPNLIYEVDGDINIGDISPDDGSQLRPHIVWFGESVPNLLPAIEMTATADIIVIIGTSMNVYPAASIYEYAKSDAEIYYIDPNPATSDPRVTVIKENATTGVAELIEKLKKNL